MRLRAILYVLSGLTGIAHAGVANTQCATTAAVSPTPAGAVGCQTVYPASIRQIYSYYPNLTSDARDYNMLVRSPEFEVATEMQFRNVPKAGHTCQLALVVPEADFVVGQGKSRIVNIYQVEAGPESVPSWKTYAGNTTDASVWGSIDAGDSSLQSVRERRNNKIAVNTAACNETLTFQVGFATPGSPDANYWGFPNVVPPAFPAMGWRVVHSC